MNSLMSRLGNRGDDVEVQLREMVASVSEPFGDHRHHQRPLASRARALDNRRPHVYVNRVGSEADLRFEGGSRVVDQNGNIVYQAEAVEQVAEVLIALDRIVDPELQCLEHLRERLPVSLQTC